jgi:hypothetical protein
MPSNQDPASVVNPGPGRLPAGVVPAGAIFPGGGGGGGAFAALQAHIHNNVDAHLAHAIGVDPYYPPLVGPTPDPILTSVGGPVDGESVLDFIDEFKDLIPPHPNYLGFDVVANITNGIPSWDVLNAAGVGTGTAETGGYANGANVQFTHFLVPTTSTTFALSGILFPADRGVVALYKNTNGNFFDPTHTTLVAALWLGDVSPIPPPAGIPASGFSENNRRTQQTNYTASGAGLDQISLTFRYPYLASYTGYTPPPVPYGPFPTNFFRFQLANFAVTAQAISVGDTQDWLLVHWRETYAVSLTVIQPAHLTLASLVSTNCYSATPTAGNFDDNTNAVYNVNRHNVFQDSSSGSSPVGTAFTSAPVGTVTTQFLSGVQYYNSTGLEWNMDVQATGLFAQSFQTGSSDNPPHVPAQFHSAFDPIQMDFTNFGGGIFPVPYYAMKKHLGAAYDFNNTPLPGDTGEYQNLTLAIYTPAPFMPSGGYAQLTADLRTPFHETVYVDPNKYLIDTYTPGTQPTTVFEPFVDEYYRYITSFDPTSSATVSIVPAGGNVFPSATALLVTGADLQVVGQEVVYPQTDYNVATFFPAQVIDYSGFPAGDGVDHLRRYQRAVDTGLPRNTGWIRLRGLAQAAFTTNAAYNGTETTGHLTGGAIVQIKIPGATGSDWLDLGRAYGDPGLVGALGTSPFYGCSTSVIISGSDIYVSFNMGPNFTSNNGSGNFLLFVRVTFINGPGTGLVLDQFQWYPPTFTPP